MLFRKFLNLENGKRQLNYIWDLLLFYRYDYTAEDSIEIPVGKILQMHSPIVDAEIFIDGEVYIL